MLAAALLFRNPTVLDRLALCALRARAAGRRRSGNPSPRTVMVLVLAPIGTA
jgi:hypothetical protein